MKGTSMNRRSFVLGGAAAATVLAAGLTGCGGNSEDKSADGDAAPEATGTGTLTGACAYTSTNYNPIGNSSALMLAATWHVFEGLYDLDLHTYQTYNALAADEPVEVSETEYEVTLRDGAKFSDGTDVTADDVVNAFEANIADATYGAFLEFIDSVEAKDDATVTFKLKYPFGSLLKERLSVVKIYPASQTEDDLQTMPIGTGPWAYSSINGDEGGAIEFTPNENYNGSLAAGAASMHWDVLVDDTARTTAMSEGSVQVMENVPDANVEQIEGAGATVEYVDGFNQPFFMFNTQKAPFDDKRVRQAFFYAIDTEKLISNQMVGHANAVKSFLPANHANYHEASTVYTYDPEKAKSLLKEAGADGTKLELLVNSNWVSSLSAQIKEDLDAVGLDVTLNVTVMPWEELAPKDDDAILPFDVALTPGDPSCFGNDPDLLMSWWYGDNVWTQGRSCWQKADPDTWGELNDKLQQAREASGDEQQQLWNECFDIIAEEVPLYALFHRQLATGYDANSITGFKPISTTGLVFLGASA